MKRAKPLGSTKILPRRLPPDRKTPMPKSRPATTPARKAAKGMPCLMNVANVCNYDNATTVLGLALIERLRAIANPGVRLSFEASRADHVAAQLERVVGPEGRVDLFLTPAQQPRVNALAPGASPVCSSR